MGPALFTHNLNATDIDITRSTAMRTLFRSLAVVSLLSLSAPAAQAVEVRGLFNMGYEFGGDLLYTVVYYDGSSDTIDANKGFNIGGGLSFVWDQRGAMETQVTMNYRFDKYDGYGGTVEFNTVPLEIIQVFNVDPQVSLGVGFTRHMNPKVTGTGVASWVNDRYDDANGFLFQVGFRLSDRSQLGMRYTNIKYKGAGLPEADGSGFGFFFSMGFGGTPPTPRPYP